VDNSFYYGGDDENENKYDYIETSASKEYSCASYYDNIWANLTGWGGTLTASGSCVLRQAQTLIYPNGDIHCLDDDVDDSILSEDKICAYNPHSDSEASWQEKNS